jgi:hypothetical protein
LDEIGPDFLGVFWFGFLLSLVPGFGRRGGWRPKAGTSVAREGILQGLT